jgi:hypothetical protein
MVDPYYQIASPDQYHPQAATGTQIDQTRADAVRAVPVRRATYIHVSDLISAYNIDHKSLEAEIARVRIERDAGGHNGTFSSSTISKSSQPASALTSVSVPALHEPKNTSLETTSTSTKRLQPPRRGFNLCVYVQHCLLLRSNYFCLLFHLTDLRSFALIPP